MEHAEKEWVNAYLSWCMSSEWLARKGRELQVSAGVTIAPDALAVLNAAAGRLPKKLADAAQG